MAKFLGLDLSLTATGIATTRSARTINDAGQRGLPRMRLILAEIVAALDGVDLVAIEGPSYGSPSSQQTGHHERAGLWWLVRYRLWHQQTPLIVVPPKTLKKYATGNGNADKSAVRSATVARFPWFNGDHNAADALMLAAFAADLAGEPIVAMPEHHRAALKAVKLPDLGPWHGKAA